MTNASITVTAEWCMGHRLPNHQGKCFNLHGHQYRAEVTVQGRINTQVGSPSEGMVMDFSEVKNKLKAFVEDFDHKFLVEVNDPLLGVDSKVSEYGLPMPGLIYTSFVPTAENIAAQILDRLGPPVTKVTVWETPTSFATVWRWGRWYS